MPDYAADKKGKSASRPCTVYICRPNYIIILLIVLELTLEYLLSLSHIFLFNFCVDFLLKQYKVFSSLQYSIFFLGGEVREGEFPLQLKKNILEIKQIKC